MKRRLRGETGVGENMGVCSMDSQLMGTRKLYAVVSAVAMCLLLLSGMSATRASAEPVFGITSFEGGAFDVDGLPDFQAGSHPQTYSTTFLLSELWAEDGLMYATEDMKDAVVDLPPGLVGNASAIPQCTEVDLQGGADFIASGGFLGSPACPVETQVGYVVIHRNGNFLPDDGAGSPGVPAPAWESVYNMKPPHGKAALFGFSVGGALIHFSGQLIRDESVAGGYTVRVAGLNAPQTLPLAGVGVTMWGVPADPSIDSDRGNEGSTYEGNSCARPNSPPECHFPSSEPRVPFLSMPTSCGDPLKTEIEVTSWQGGIATSEFLSGANLDPLSPVGLTGCDTAEFAATVDARPSTSVSESASGLAVRMEVPQSDDPDGRATPHVRDVTVTLPRGVILNASSANGLTGCSLAQVALSSNEPAGCPNSSKVGTVEIETPLLEHSIPGAVYVGRPFDNPFNSLLAIYIAVNDPISGTVVKLPGEVALDSQSGQLTSTFEENPQVPFDSFELNFFEGAAAPLITPALCGSYTTRSEITPWSAPDSGPPVVSTDTWSITGAPGGRSCATSNAARPFSPSLNAGTVSSIAGAFSPFVLRLTRPDGHRDMRSINMTLPEGLTGKLAGIPYCSEASLAKFTGRTNTAPGTAQGEIDSPSCPAASRVGRAVIGAGAGPRPFYLNTARAYLAGPYKGAPLSLAVIAPVKAGPFDLGTVMVRNALHINDRTAQVTVISDPMPTILEGIPVKIRDLRVIMDRPGFTLNPTSCDPMQVQAQIGGSGGQTANLTSRFQVGECARLGFAPRFGIQNLNPGRRSTLRSFNPAMRFTVAPRPGDANLGPTEVILPSAIILDQSNIRTVCTRDQFASRTCPDRSIYGHAKAWSPLLDQPVEGPVYLGSSPNPLPDIIADLKGQIDVVLQGQIDAAPGGRIRNAFNVVPDVPVTRFELTMFGGANRGVLVNSRDLCTSRERGVARFRAANGKLSVQRPAVGIRFNCRALLRQEARRAGARRRAIVRAFRSGRISRAQARRLLQRLQTGRAGSAQANRMSPAQARRAVRR